MRITINTIYIALLLSFATPALTGEYCQNKLAKLLDHALTYNKSTISLVNSKIIKNLTQPRPKVESIVSFGSGGDVLTPIFTYPNSKNYHLVDILTGWGAGPGEIIFVIIRRLEHISESKVEIVSDGFTRLVSRESYSNPKEFDQWTSQDSFAQSHFAFDNSFWEYWGWPTEEKFNPQAIKPLILEFQIEGEIKFVYLHPLDFDKETHVKNLLSYFNDGLGGILITGAALPRSIRDFINILGKEGSFIFQEFQQMIVDEDFLRPFGKVHKFDLDDPYVNSTIYELIIKN